MDARERMMNLLRTLRGEEINICSEVYKILTEEQGRGAELLQFFCENAESVESSEKVEAQQVFTEGETLDYTKRYGKIVDGILENLLRQKLSITVFYVELWAKITLREVFENEKAQIFALYYVWIDSRIPYFELPESICLEKEEYRQTIDKLRRKVQEARFILASDFEQWTQVSYLLVKVLDTVDDKKEKAVLLSCIMQIRDNMLMRARIQRITEGEQDNE